MLNAWVILPRIAPVNAESVGLPFSCLVFFRPSCGRGMPRGGGGIALPDVAALAVLLAGVAGKPVAERRFHCLLLVQLWLLLCPFLPPFLEPLVVVGVGLVGKGGHIAVGLVLPWISN